MRSMRKFKDVKQFEIFVKNLPWTVCKETLEQHFSKYGKVKNIRYKLDHRTGFYKQYAFIDMEDREGFNKALESDAHIIDNAKCPVKSNNRSDDWWEMYDS